MPEISTIEVFPNSGHHYTFVPFDKAVLDRFPQLKKVCAEGRQPWWPLNYTWTRGRYAMRDGQAGMWVAVESNAGGLQRGAVYEPRHAVADPPAEAPTSPYAVPDVTRLPGEPVSVKIKVPLPGTPNTVIDAAELQIVWKQPSSANPIDVDLIVDFGNTRTVVLALENREAQNGSLASVCRSVRFMPQGVEYRPYPGHNRADDTNSIVDSWFVLHEPGFSNLEPPSANFKPVTEPAKEETQVPSRFGLGAPKVEVKHFATTRLPQMFVELSPVVMGDGAREILANLDIERGGNYSLSSPKRYAWDKDVTREDGREFWTMVLNRWNQAKNNRTRLPTLAGSMLCFLPANGHNWSIDAPPNESPERSHRPVPNPDQPSYPRSDAITWAALGIIELAHRQITSEEWRRGSNPYIPRRLRNVMVTFPSGWSTLEFAAYRDKWQKAINIFTLAHLQDRREVAEGGQRPTLLMDLDEAVASQLPFVYSEISQLHNRGENWIELFGRGKNTDARVRLMTVDIGGGTTDISIVEYGDTLVGGVELTTKLLFRDSSSTAGDALTKEIIERVLLPALGTPFRGTPAHEEEFRNIFHAQLPDNATKARWSRVVKLVFLPIVRRWLTDLSRGTVGNPETGGTPWTPSRMLGAEGRLVDEAVLREFNEFCRNSPLGHEIGSREVLGDDDPIPYFPDDINACIKDVFEPVILSLAKYAAAFEVDLVTLSGKPSELPRVKLLLEELLPILPQRIIQARDFPAGNWYPMSSDGKIHDAKSVTAVGAALYQAIHNGWIEKWSIRREDPEQTVSQHSPALWGMMPARSRGTDFDPLYLGPGDDEATHPMLIGTAIGRKLFASAAKPEQVYRLRWRDKKSWGSASRAARLDVTLRRTTPEEAVEYGPLRLAAVEGTVANQAVTLNDVELQLCTMESDEYWIDAARFDVIWP